MVESKSLIYLYYGLLRKQIEQAELGRLRGQWGGLFTKFDMIG